MFAPIRTAAIAAAIACLPVPAIAQDEPEEPRTSYQISLIKLADGAQDRWMEILTEHTNPAREAAGVPLPTVHWLVNGHWHLMLVSELRGGLASFYSHNPAASTAYQAALRQQLGSDAAVDALNKEVDELVEDSDRMLSHTHP
jgi:hypothetical protein